MKVLTYADCLMPTPVYRRAEDFSIFISHVSEAEFNDTIIMLYIFVN